MKTKMKKIVASLLALVMVIGLATGFSQSAQAAETTVDTTLYSHSGNGVGAFYIKTSKATGLKTGVNYKGIISVDGVAKNVNVYNVDGSIFYVNLEQAGLGAVAGQTVVTVEGTLSDETNTAVFNKAIYKYTAEGAWQQQADLSDATYVETSIYTHGGNGTNGFYFKTSKATGLATNGWTKYTGIISVDGVAKASVPVFNVDGTIFYIGLVDAEITAVAGQTVVTVEGILTDGSNTAVFNKQDFEYTAEGTWQKEMPITYVDTKLYTGAGYTAADQFYFITTTDTGLPAGNYRGIISVDGVARDVVTENVDGSIFWVGLGNSNITAVAGQTVVTVEGTLTDGNIAVAFNKADYEYTEAGEWQRVIEAQEVTLSEYSNKGSVNGFYFQVSPADELTYEGNWQRYTGNVIYVDGVLRSDVPIFKAVEDVYYVGLVDAGIVPVAEETIVKVEGKLTGDLVGVDFQTAYFRYRANGKWQIVADINAPREYTIDQYRSGETYTYPTQAGKVFAGWYTDDTFETPLAADVTTGSAYAKFVDAETLTVKAQVTAGANASSAEADIRFVSSVDTLNYKEVGFDITVEGREKKNVSITTVYDYLTIVSGETVDERKASELFSEDSEYFFAYSYWKVPQANFGTTFTVEPYWVTLDGTTVYGETAVKTVAQGL